MKLPPAVEQIISETRARVRLGFPWWLRPFLARDVAAITLGRRIFVRPDVGERPPDAIARLLRHELVHVRQVNRLGLPRFLWQYTSEFVRHFRRERDVARAYRLISFEVEAWAEEQRADV